MAAQLETITVLDLTSPFKRRLNASQASSSDADGKGRAVGQVFVNSVPVSRYGGNWRGSAGMQPPLIPFCGASWWAQTVPKTILEITPLCVATPLGRYAAIKSATAAMKLVEPVPFRSEETPQKIWMPDRFAKISALPISSSRIGPIPILIL